MGELQRGRLGVGSDAPDHGERMEVLGSLGGVTVEHILSGELEAPVDYDQDHDEWVLVLEGAATLDVAGDRLSLRTGDWLLLPAGTRHVLQATEPGTRWLALHAAPGER
jgi:cupin 2 domain-containing protein